MLNKPQPNKRKEFLSFIRIFHIQKIITTRHKSISNRYTNKSRDLHTRTNAIFYGTVCTLLPHLHHRNYPKTEGYRCYQTTSGLQPNLLQKGIGTPGIKAEKILGTPQNLWDLFISRVRITTDPCFKSYGDTKIVIPIDTKTDLEIQRFQFNKICSCVRFFGNICSGFRFCFPIFS